MGQKNPRGCGEMNDFKLWFWQWAELLPAEPALAEQHSPIQTSLKSPELPLAAALRPGISLCSQLLKLHSTFQKSDSISGKYSTFFVMCSNDSYMPLRDIILCEFLKETAHRPRDGINVMKCLGALPSCWLKQTKEAAFHPSSHREDKKKKKNLTALPTLTKPDLCLLGSTRNISNDPFWDLCFRFSALLCPEQPHLLTISQIEASSSSPHQTWQLFLSSSTLNQT